MGHENLCVEQIKKGNKTRTIQTLDRDNTEGQREHRKSNFQLWGHMIYQNDSFDETNRKVQKLDFNDQ